MARNAMKMPSFPIIQEFYLKKNKKHWLNRKLSERVKTMLI